MERKIQPHLRLVRSPHLELCSSTSAIAASPVGTDVRPFSISLTDDCAKPINRPISANVSPVLLSSVMREDHLDIAPSLREPVALRQRSSVTTVRETMSMPRPKDMPHDLTTKGQRVRWWREHRKLTRQELAKAAGLSYSGLADFENDRQNGTRKLHLIAAKLRLNAHYLETGKGEPESEYAQEPPNELHWPFETITPARFDRLSMVERRYAEDRLLEVLGDIEVERRKTKRG